MPSAADWKSDDCRTLIDGPKTRKCPNCGGINFHPLANEVPDDEHSGTIESDIALDKALEHLSTEEF